MTTPTPLVVNYKVSGITLSGSDKVIVSFSQDIIDGPQISAAQYGQGTINLILDLANAKTYFPGQNYQVSFSAV